MSITNLLSKTWPDWKIVREIGAGSEGTVFMIKKHEDCTDAENYAALKVLQIPAALTNSRPASVYRCTPEILEEMSRHPSTIYGTGYRWYLETKTTEPILNHPNIVHLQDWTMAEDSGKAWLLMRMELLLPLDEYRSFHIEKIGADICTALSVLHSSGLFHLDVKPGNIFVSRDGTFKLGDFGSARNLYDISTGDFTAGTLHYAAPELRFNQWICHTLQNAVHADIYSLGMVLFELLIWEEYGRNCHGPADEVNQRKNWFDIQSCFETRGMDVENEQSSDIRAVIRKALNPSPCMRHDSADQMKEAILNTVATKTLNPNQDGEISLEEAFQQFVCEDVRNILILKYQSGAHRRFAGYPYVGSLSGLRLTYAGHEPPEKIWINGAEILFLPQDGFIDLSLIEIYKKSTWPMHMDIAVQYQHAQEFEWSIILGEPNKHWEWFKRPDWT